MLGRHVFEWREIVDSRVIDENVELVKGLFRFNKEALDLGRLGESGLDSDSLATFALDLLYDTVRALFAGGIIDDNGSTFCRQMAGDGCADALGRTGNDRHFALKLLRHDWTPCAERTAE